MWGAPLAFQNVRWSSSRGIGMRICQGWARLVHGRDVTGHASPFGQFPEHVAGVGVGKVGAGLGQIWADLDLGPKTKFEARELLYIFYLKCTVIRVVD